MPFVSNVTVIGEAPPVADRVVCPAAVQVTVKPVIGLPPSVPGVNAMVACPLPGTAVPIVGAAGAVPGLGSTTVPVAPALFVGVLVAVARLRSIESVPSVGIDGKLTKSTPAKFIVRLLVKTKPF